MEKNKNNVSTNKANITFFGVTLLCCIVLISCFKKQNKDFNRIIKTNIIKELERTNVSYSEVIIYKCDTIEYYSGNNLKFSKAISILSDELYYTPDEKAQDSLKITIQDLSDSLEALKMDTISYLYLFDLVFESDTLLYEAKVDQGLNNFKLEKILIDDSIR